MLVVAAADDWLPTLTTVTDVREFRAAVGEVAHAAAGLESVTAIITWGLAGVEQTLARTVVPNNMSRMLDLIKELLPVRVADVQLRAAVMAWAKDARIAYGKRGSILHSVWIGPDGANRYFRGDLKPLPGELTYMTAADVLAVAVELSGLAQGDRLAFIGELARTVPGPWSVAASDPQPLTCR